MVTEFYHMGCVGVWWEGFLVVLWAYVFQVSVRERAAGALADGMNFGSLVAMNFNSFRFYFKTRYYYKTRALYFIIYANVCLSRKYYTRVSKQATMACCGNWEIILVCNKEDYFHI